MRPDAVAARAGEGGGEGPAAVEGEPGVQPAAGRPAGAGTGAGVPPLAFHLVTTARELARPDCDGRYLCDWWTAARGGRAVVYDYGTPAGRAAARALFAREDGGPAAVARHFALHGPAQSAKRRRQAERAAAGPPVPGALGCGLEVDRCRKALAEWLALPPAAPAAGSRAAKAREAKRRHLAASAALLRRTVGDAVAFAKAAASAGARADEPERALEAGLAGGGLKLVLFPAPHFSVEVAVPPALPATAADLSFLPRARGLRGVEIVLIDETWPEARRIFEDLASGGPGDGDGDGEDGEDGEVERILRGLFEADDEWAALEAAGRETHAAAFLRRAFVITLAPEDPEAREGYGLVSNFPRGQEDAERGVGVCSLEAGLRLGELAGLLSAADRRAGQAKCNAWLGEQLGKGGGAMTAERSPGS